MSVLTMTAKWYYVLTKYANVVLFSKFCESFQPPLAIECIYCTCTVCFRANFVWDLRDETKIL